MTPIWRSYGERWNITKYELTGELPCPPPVVADGEDVEKPIGFGPTYALFCLLALIPSIVVRPVL